MTTRSRPRRSALYVPGDNPRVLDKAKKLPADVLIFDLEDAVGPEAKASARKRVCELIDSGAYHPRELVVRINGLGTDWHGDDLRAVASSRAHGILIPKVNSAAEVRLLVEALDAAGATEHLQLWVMVETPAAFLHAEEIAAASEQLEVLVIGTNDLINDIHALHLPGRSPIMAALSLSVLAAKSAGKTILDGVFNSIEDDAGFANEARQGRAMGFDGKTVIHPSQLAPANAAFAPSRPEVDHARAIITAYDKAREAGESVLVVDGRMVEGLHVRDAHRILRLHELATEIDCATPSSV
ncbi:citrate lyase [Rhodococcus sp. SC4]|uniref:HpcH/HpaI aldolase/citrate lyase family protein n=1 Tax=unclassified Rhodococcus (in: high G+C Gram-positive bacteria) TaxID=192944 RepID=UPI00076A4F49|nr:MULTISPECIES: CoA ester lyase [unclassified Rhodococcus (in: high G+C Gram-positive bacteria)]KXF49298.1 citrate lyase [Rhodococcus sp. SC4]KXX63100.1 citrate lyase [Rhodococcus sp. LB1]PBC56359.1 CoA ester lyase [Rhodococcus sp. ACPA1]